jgi:hypothetical protein
LDQLGALSIGRVLSPERGDQLGRDSGLLHRAFG